MKYTKNRENIFILIFFVHFCSSLYFFIIWYQSSNLIALVATFIMAEIIDPSQYFSSPYHVSSQQHMVCSIGTQQERQFFGDQSKTMNDSNRSSFGRRYTSNVCNYCGKTGHVIDTCYRRHNFPSQFKFKNIKQTIIIINRIMKVQGQRYILSILVLLQSSIKHC